MQNVSGSGSGEVNLASPYRNCKFASNPNLQNGRSTNNMFIQLHDLHLFLQKQPSYLQYMPAAAPT